MVRVPYDQEVWVGNIPKDMTEQKVTDELALYDILPHTIILRYYGRNPDGFAILAFASVALAEQCLRRDLKWHSNRPMLFRRKKPYVQLAWVARGGGE